MKKYADESIKIHERLVNENNTYTTMPILKNKYGCEYEDVRYGAIQGIACTYFVIDEIDKAIEWANKLPNIDCTAQMILSRILKYELDCLCKCKYDDSDIPNEIKRFKEYITEFEKYARNEVGFTE